VLLDYVIVMYSKNNDSLVLTNIFVKYTMFQPKLGLCV
jgi:hypothetical protein